MMKKLKYLILPLILLVFTINGTNVNAKSNVNDAQIIKEIKNAKTSSDLEKLMINNFVNDPQDQAKLLNQKTSEHLTITSSKNSSFFYKYSPNKGFYGDTIPSKILNEYNKEYSNLKEKEDKEAEKYLLIFFGGVAILVVVMIFALFELRHFDC